MRKVKDKKRKVKDKMRKVKDKMHKVKDKNQKVKDKKDKTNKTPPPTLAYWHYVGLPLGDAKKVIGNCQHEPRNAISEPGLHF